MTTVYTDKDLNLTQLGEEAMRAYGKKPGERPGYRLSGPDAEGRFRLRAEGISKQRLEELVAAHVPDPNFKPDPSLTPPSTPKPPTPEERIAALEARLAELEGGR
jgi:hypothetical protein